MGVLETSCRVGKAALLAAVVTMSSHCGHRPGGEESVFERANPMAANLYPAIPVNGVDSTDTGAIALAANVPTLRGFYFETKGPGTLVLLKSEINWGGCRREQIVITTWLKSWTPSGELAGVTVLDVHRPVRLSKPVRAIIEVAVRSPEDCSGLSVRTLLKFYEQQSEGAGAGSSGSGDGQEGDGSPAPADTDHGQNGTPDPGVENPPHQPTPSTGSDCPALADPLPSDLPVQVGARLELFGRNSEREGCQRTMTWFTGDNLRRDPANGCRALPLSAIADGQPGGAQLVKWQEEQPNVPRQLFWVNGGNQAQAAVIAATLRAGGVLRLSRDESCAGTAAQPVVQLANDADLLIFVGDPRLGPYRNGGVPETLALDTGASQPLTVAYRYDDATAAGFNLTVEWKFWDGGRIPAAAEQGIKAAFYNRRTRSYVTGWQSLPSASFLAGRWHLEDSAALRRILPRLGELELMVARERTGAAVLGAYPLYSAYNDPTMGSAFQDLSRPGRNRFTLREADLP